MMEVVHKLVEYTPPNSTRPEAGRQWLEPECKCTVFEFFGIALLKNFISPDAEGVISWK